MCVCVSLGVVADGVGTTKKARGADPYVARAFRADGESQVAHLFMSTFIWQVLQKSCIVRLFAETRLR